MSELLLDAEIEILILKSSLTHVELQVVLKRIPTPKGVREDMLNAMFKGNVLKAFDFPSVTPGTTIQIGGLKAKVDLTF